ncbi:dTDP-4-dehydrorhamnose 3,5-epimerase [Allomuricauda sp. d1]|uniref:dTDP-4-dehydrorhamnose 3,5-epimerase n=1 Tax=Allomuricauda sp. d1 TaxID=3136725 RepID=UPI0031DD0842
MKLTETKLADCFLIEHDVFKDERGLFLESYNKAAFEKLTGLKINFIQDNISISKRGVLRGLHYQSPPYEQAKLITVLKGEVIDVVVDIRKNSDTFGTHLKFRMHADERKSLFIPKGMAHGFLALSDEVLFHYKCDAYYNPASESGILYNDAELQIDWEFLDEAIILSDKDKELPNFNIAPK